MRILREGLVENSNDNQPSLATGSYLGELLEEMDVRSTVYGLLKKLAHLVDEHHQPAASTRVSRSGIL